MGRRGRGEGSIYKRADGRWCAYVTLGGQVRRHVYGGTRQEVAAKLATAVKTKNDGLPLPSDRETVGSFLTTWLGGRRHQLRPRTWERQEQYVRLHALPALGRVPLTRLGPQHLQRLYDERLAAGLSPTTVHHLHATLHKALDQAMRWGLVVRNVADLVDPPRVARFEMTVLTPPQVRQLLRVAAGGPLEALVTVAVTTGMRRGELLALRWRDVDLERGTVSVTGTVQLVCGRLDIREPKTARSRRQIELSTAGVAALRRHRIAQTERRLLLGQEWNDHDLVFPSSLGRLQEGRHMFYGQFQPLLAKAGLPTMRFHDLRHTAATLMLARGIHPKIVSEMLGHSTIAITLDLYSHVTPTMQRQAASAMDDVLAGE